MQLGTQQLLLFLTTGEGKQMIHSTAVQYVSTLADWHLKGGSQTRASSTLQSSCRVPYKMNSSVPIPVIPSHTYTHARTHAHTHSHTHTDSRVQQTTSVVRMKVVNSASNKEATHFLVNFDISVYSFIAPYLLLG